MHERINEFVDSCLPDHTFDEFTQSLEGSQNSIDRNYKVKNKRVVHYEVKLKEN